MGKRGRGNGSLRKKTSPARGWVILLVVFSLIVVTIAGLEYLHRRTTTVPPPAHAPAPSPSPLTSYSAPRYERYTATLPPPEPAPRQKKRIGTGRAAVAIIVDDMGSSLSELRSLMSIGYPLTFSVIPVLPHAREVARGAVQGGYEVMLHLPMEPEGYPDRRIEPGALLLSLPDDEILSRMERLASVIPEAVGANNHMGSRFTADQGKMEVVLGDLKTRGLFFVDSVTTPKSVGYQTARRLGVRSARRQIFIDNDLDEVSLRRQLERLAATARRHGQAIAICHPHPETIRVLSLVMPELAREGIDFVPVSRLVE